MVLEGVACCDLSPALAGEDCQKWQNGCFSSFSRKSYRQSNYASSSHLVVPAPHLMHKLVSIFSSNSHEESKAYFQKRTASSKLSKDLSTSVNFQGQDLIYINTALEVAKILFN